MDYFKGKIKKKKGCWIWQGLLSNAGYGKATIKQKTYSAHRVSYEKSYGKIPEKMCVLHKCDNKKCVNPEHLFLGTQKDNMRDKVLKGRSANGKKNGNSKLVEKEVLKMRKLFKEGIRKAILSRMFNVSGVQVSNIISYKQWNHI